MKTVFVLLLAVFVAGCTDVLTPPVVVVHNTPASNSPRDVLANATNFGFGVRRGEMPTARKTDGAFEALLATPNAAEQFSDIFSLTNVYSKLYALCALHSLEQDRYQKLSDRIDKDETVRISNGCLVGGESTVGEILKEIESGRYDYVIKHIGKKSAEQTPERYPVGLPPSGSR